MSRANAATLQPTTYLLLSHYRRPFLLVCARQYFALDIERINRLTPFRHQFMQKQEGGVEQVLCGGPHTRLKDMQKRRCYPGKGCGALQCSRAFPSRLSASSAEWVVTDSGEDESASDGDSGPYKISNFVTLSLTFGAWTYRSAIRAI